MLRRGFDSRLLDQARRAADADSRSGPGSLLAEHLAASRRVRHVLVIAVSDLAGA